MRCSILKPVLFILFSLSMVIADAQCVMCRTQVVNNVSHGETALAAGLNLGIMYLFFTPYVVLGVVAFFWYRNAKVNERKKPHMGHISR